MMKEAQMTDKLMTKNDDIFDDKPTAALRIPYKLLTTTFNAHSLINKVGRDTLLNLFSYPKLIY